MFVAECKCEACERSYPAPSFGPTIDHRICCECHIEAVVWAAKQARREVKFNECRWGPRHGREEARIAAENMVTRAVNVPAPNNAAEGPRQRMWQLFHQCWGQASDSMRYDKGTWLALEKELLGAKTIREEIVELADRGESKSMMLAPSELRPDLPVNFREFL